MLIQNSFYKSGVQSKSWKLDSWDYKSNHAFCHLGESIKFSWTTPTGTGFAQLLLSPSDGEITKHAPTLMHCKTELALWATNCWPLKYWNLKSLQYLKLIKSLWLVSLRRNRLQGNWIQQLQVRQCLKTETEMFSFLKALCNVHWMENCRGRLLLLPLAYFTFHWTSKANVYRRNLTAIHLTVLPLFRLEHTDWCCKFLLFHVACC